MKEIRSIENSEVRVIPNSRKVNGYALLFNIESQDLGGFREIILPEALNGVLEKSDILATYNHDENSVLARNTNGSGTLSLNVDNKGLQYSFEAPETSLGETIIQSIKRGDLRNSSFAFTVEDSGVKWEKRSDGYLRTITQFDKLWDCSPVYRPAYSDTTVAVRSLDEIKNNDLEEMRKKLEQTVEKENKLVDERQNIEIEVSVEVSDDAVELEPDEMNPEMHCPDETMVEELVDIVYNGNTYSIPKSVIEPYLNEVDSAQLEEYFTELDSSVEKLKKECNTQ